MRRKQVPKQKYMQRPFELQPQELHIRLEEMVDVTISDLASEFLLMPAGSSFLKYADFRAAYEVLKRHTEGFTKFSDAKVIGAVRENSRALGVVRSVLGMTPPEWAELARTDLGTDITQGAARAIDKGCRDDIAYVETQERRHQDRVVAARTRKVAEPERSKTLERIYALIRVATQYITQGAPNDVDGVIHRLAKFDTSNGLASVEYAANENVPYAVLLYERYLGRPFATHRDAISELVGEVMENAVENLLREAGVTYRKTRRAERIPGFGQAPDFCIPDEINPAVVIEAKITSDDGTARDKVARIKVLAAQRDKHLQSRDLNYEVVACIDGRGFRERREDMRQLLTQLNGKVFTTASLDHLVTHTRIREFAVGRK